MNLITKLFGRSGTSIPRARESGKHAHPPKADATARKASGKVMAPDPIDELAIGKMVHQLSFIDRSYGLGLFPTGTEHFAHDLTVMHAHRDLSSVCLQLLSENETVIFGFKVEFSRNAPSLGQFRDAACGIEVPVLIQKDIKTSRLLVTRKGGQQPYRDQLKLNWTPAQQKSQATGTAFRSQHAEKITGGRQNASFHVASEQEHQLVVVQTGTRGFAFARDVTLGVDAVYCHAEFAPAGHVFHIGQKLVAVVVQTPKGLQARNIRPA
jgi:hypothetical protein